MGIQDRDYYREGSGRFFDSWSRQGATVWLVLITSVLFFVQCLSGPPAKSPLVEFGAYSYADVMAGEVWRLVTPVFLHANVWNLVVNMLLLYWTGSRLEDLYGSREFLAFYLVGGLFAQSNFLLTQAIGATNPLPVVIGSSGAVTATLVLFALHFPWQRVHVWFVLPMPVSVLILLYIGFDALSATGFGRGDIGYVFVPLGGALYGALYRQAGLRFCDLFARSQRAEGRVRPALRVIPPPDDTPEPVGAAVESQPRSKEAADDFEARVDAVLEKVSKLGRESLTAEEREVLVKASELYKKRRK